MNSENGLTAEQLRAFHQALMKAFPRIADLAQMVRLWLDENPEVIASGGSLDEKVLALLTWAGACDKYQELLFAARKANPGNRTLQVFAASLGFTDAQSPQPTAGTSLDSFAESMPGPKLSNLDSPPAYGSQNPISVDEVSAYPVNTVPAKEAFLIEPRVMQFYREIVSALAPLPEEQGVISGTRSGLLLLWDPSAPTRQPEAVLPPVQSGISCVAIAAPYNKREALIGTVDGRLQRWDLILKRQMSSHQICSGPVQALSVTPDRKIIAVGKDGTVVVCDLDKDRKPHTLSLPFEITAHAIGSASDASEILIATHDYTIRLVNLHSGNTQRLWRGHTGTVSVITVLDDQRILSGACDGTLRLWESTAEREIRVIETGQGAVNAMVVLTGGQHVCSGGENGTVKVWDLATGGELLALQSPHRWVQILQLTAYGRYLLSAGEGSRIGIWKLPS